MKKRTVSELLRLACLYAEQELESLLDAYSNIPEDPFAAETRDFLQQLHEYRIRRWGRTEMERICSEANLVSIMEAAQ